MISNKLLTALLAAFCMTALAVPAPAQLAFRKKDTGPSYMGGDARTATRTTRKTDDPYGFLDGGKRKKKKDCDCPHSKKGERKRRKEFRNNRKRR